MSILDWLTGGSEVKYTQSPEQQQVYSALLPLLQRLGASGSGSNTNSFISNYNKGVNPWTGQATTYPTASRANLGTVSQPYPTSANATGTRSNQMLSKQLLLANINKQRIAKGLEPITLSSIQ